MSKGANGETIMREIVTPKNPQTDAQLIQRVIMATVMKAYGAMKEITDHSFEGYTAGQQTMGRFQSLNAKALRTRIEDEIHQGYDLGSIFAFSKLSDARFVPGDYIISAGSLPTVAAAIVSATASNPMSLTATPEAVSGSNNWTLTISDLDQYDSSNNAYKYRFVEIRTGTTYAVEGDQVGNYRVSYGVETGNIGLMNQTSNPYTQTITNVPGKIKLDILKLVKNTYTYISSTGEVGGTKLAGAIFRLTKVDPNNNNATLGEWTFAATDAQGAADLSGTTPANGYASISDGLDNGTYQIREIVSPVGYNLNNVVIEFVVSAGTITSLNNTNGSCLVTASLENGVPRYTENGGVKTYHFVFENSTGAELPSTGERFGLSRMGFASLGTVLLTAFVVLYQYKKQRQYYGEWKEN